MTGYDITEKDIQGMLHYLKVFHPENANREFAEEMLAYMKATYRRLAFAEPEEIEKLYKSFEKSKSNMKRTEG